MSAPHPRFPDSELPSIKQILAAFGPPPGSLRINGHPYDLDEARAAVGHTTTFTCPIEPLEAPNRLDQIAAILLQLTWGEMVQLAAELWACRGDGFEGDGLQKALHRWATEK